MFNFIRELYEDSKVFAVCMVVSFLFLAALIGLLTYLAFALATIAPCAALISGLAAASMAVSVAWLIERNK